MFVLPLIEYAGSISHDPHPAINAPAGVQPLSLVQPKGMR
jgi:hypothetical protein